MKKYLVLICFSTLSHLFAFDTLVGIMVEFQTDVDPETSGDGTFLQIEDLDPALKFIDFNDKYRCNPSEHFVLDQPPHNKTYFDLQMKAVQNYYKNIFLLDPSDNLAIPFDIIMIDDIFTLDNNMKYYSISDERIGLLFSDALDKVHANIDIDNFINSNVLGDVAFVVFHAGLGQESATDFDPTIYDIRSAYIDDDMLGEISENAWIYNKPNRGLVMPETLNMIYYDVVEVSYPNSSIESEIENFYCDYQTGMTGLFAHLLGYEYGFKPLYNVENGQTRIGRFGLMDIGFYNGRGVIPSPPSAWTRTNEVFKNLDIIEIQDITEHVMNNFPDGIQSSLGCRGCMNEQNQLTDHIKRIKISEDEYFLIENRTILLNAVCSNPTYISEKSCIDASSSNTWETELNVEQEYTNNIIQYQLSNTDNYPPWFDILANDKGDYFEIDKGMNLDYDYNVVTKVKNYDSAIPGSGILIWHINEALNTAEYGINNDLYNKVVSLEEGDGSNDIGENNPYYGFPGEEQYISGKGRDTWYIGNIFYQNVNEHINNFNDNILFNDVSYPNSNTSSGVMSNLSIEILSEIDNIMSFNAKIDYSNSFDIDVEIDFIDIDYGQGEIIKYLGNSGGIDNHSCVYYYYLGQEQVKQKCAGMNDQNHQDNLTIPPNTDNPKLLYYNNGNSIIVDGYANYLNHLNHLQTDNEAPSSIGYFNSLDINNPDIVESALALGNLDEDEYDEQVYINSSNSLFVENSNGTPVNGFPIHGSYFGHPLISDMNGDGKADIICKNGDKISIISNTGTILHEIPLINSEDEIALIPKWGAANNIALLNGYKLHVFKNVYDENYSFWNNARSTVGNYPIVTGSHNIQNNVNSLKGIDLNRTYNYPNPTEDNNTKFRFYVYNSNSVNISIYDAAGFKVDTLSKTNLTHNEYNEIVWSFSGLSSGLYFAEVKSDQNQIKIIKVVVI